MSGLETLLSQVGFSRFEAQCLLCLAASSPMSGEAISQTTGITYNMTKVMLGGLERRGLIKLEPSADQDMYRFTGKDVLLKYLDTEKNVQLERFEAAIEAVQSLK